MSIPVPTATAAAGVAIVIIQSLILLKLEFIVETNFGYAPKVKLGIRIISITK